ncbi:MAG: hypothetical protein EYC62_04450 [Alphaproteobacteria bacterium]|nr:MAG: hypothetical protein EYC62_04450 [Alphaproteobacteria bacterium]
MNNDTTFKTVEIFNNGNSSVCVDSSATAGRIGVMRAMMFLNSGLWRGFKYGLACVATSMAAWIPVMGAYFAGALNMGSMQKLMTACSKIGFGAAHAGAATLIAYNIFYAVLSLCAGRPASSFPVRMADNAGDNGKAPDRVHVSKLILATASVWGAAVFYAPPRLPFRPLPPLREYRQPFSPPGPNDRYGIGAPPLSAAVYKTLETGRANGRV